MAISKHITLWWVVKPWWSIPKLDLSPYTINSLNFWSCLWNCKLWDRRFGNCREKVGEGVCVCVRAHVCVCVCVYVNTGAIIQLGVDISRNWYVFLKEKLLLKSFNWHLWMNAIFWHDAWICWIAVTSFYLPCL